MSEKKNNAWNILKIMKQLLHKVFLLWPFFFFIVIYFSQMAFVRQWAWSDFTWHILGAFFLIRTQETSKRSQFCKFVRDRCFVSIDTKASWACQALLVVKSQPANTGDLRDAASLSGSGRCPGGRNGSPRQYSRLENPMDRGAWQNTVHSVTKSQT